MSAAEVYLKFKAFLEDKVSAGWHNLVGAVQKGCQSAGKALAGMSAIFGEMPGKMGKVASGVGNMVQAFLSMGPIGAVIAGVNMALSFLANSAREAAEAYKAAVDKMAARTRALYETVHQRKLDKLNESLKEATTLAQRAARAFDAMAAAYLKVQRSRQQTSAMQGSAEIASMELAKANAMGGAQGNDRAVVGAQHDVAIAQRRRALAESAAAEEVENAVKEEKDARVRNKMAREQVRAAEKALEDAEKDLALIEQVDAKRAAQYRTKVEAAQNALAEAKINQATKEAALTAATEAVTQARIKQAQSATDNERAVVEAKATLADAELAKRKAEETEAARRAIEEEKRRREEERALQEAESAARRKLIEEQRRQAAAAREEARATSAAASEARSRAAEASANLTAAWRLYRDKAAMQAVMDDEKAQKEAEKQFQKDFARLQSRRRDWRTADNLGVDDRATREVALAQEAKKAADEYAKTTAEAAKRAADSLDTIRSAFEEAE